MTTFLAFMTGAVVTYLLRSSMIIGGGRLVGSMRLRAALGFVTPAVLTAMVASALLLQHHRLAAPRVPEIAAVAGAFVVARRTGNVSLALAVGLPLYWIGAVAGIA
jgi:branched-subunit amino acid transport protein